MTVGRESRIDLLRGLSLLLIFVGHSEFWFSDIVRNGRGFSDASEMFVLLAGVSAALAYYKPLSSGAGWLWRKPWKRARRLYIVHMGLFALVAAVAGLCVLVPGPASDVILDALNVTTLWDDPQLNISRAIWLTYLPGNLDILPLYVVLLLLTPLLFRLHDRSKLLLAGLSLVIWLLTGIDRINFPNMAIERHIWFFDPLSWQLIFVAGITVGIRIKTGKVALPYNRLVFLAAAAFAIAAIPTNIIFHFQITPLSSLISPEFFQKISSKTNCGPLRLMNTLALLYLAWHIPAVLAASRHPAFRFVCSAGKHSLPVFVFGLILSNVINIALLLRPQTSIAVQLFVLVAGCVVQLALGHALELRKRKMIAAVAGVQAKSGVALPYDAHPSV